MSYSALVTKIHTQPIPGADRIVLGTTTQGYQVIVGSETQDGDLGVFFEAGGQLSSEFAFIHDLVRRKDEYGKPAGGYFEANRRVKAIRMRGVKSEGFWVPFWYFEYTGKIGDLNEGFAFDSLGGHEICCRYETPATRVAAKKNRAQTRGATLYFRKQPDIEQYRREKDHIPENALVYVTEKLHGTSMRFGHVLDEVKLNWFQRLLRRQPTKKWTYLNGSKNVILDRTSGRESYYGTDDFRTAAVKGLELHKGETIYGELVGWYDSHYENTIMPAHGVSQMPELAETFTCHPNMIYSYGCEVGECKLFVYRITMTNEDGVVTELSFHQVQKRAYELELAVVPLLFTQQLNEETRDRLDGYVEALVNGFDKDAIPSSLDSSHIREGVVVRWEHTSGTGFLKHKSWVFGLLEGYIKEDDNYVDTEEIA